jgi:RNA polymerase sigma-70 factor (ECF subfamily)
MYFPTTQWSVLAKASLNGETGARQALDDLCRRYRSPLQRYIRFRGYSESEAEDLTQEFLLHLLSHSALKRAKPELGRFRSFLLGALRRFLADERDRRSAQKRGGGTVHFSLEETPNLATEGEPAELIFDREWALTILENALRNLEEEFSSPSVNARFEVLRQFLPGALAPPTYEEAAARLNLSLAALKSELHRVRRRFKALVRQELATTVSAPHEIDQEMLHLQQILLNKSSDFTELQKLNARDS